MLFIPLQLKSDVAATFSVKVKVFISYTICRLIKGWHLPRDFLDLFIIWPYTLHYAYSGLLRPMKSVIKTAR